MAAAIRRLTVEFNKLSEGEIPGIVARPKSQDSMLEWSVAIAGPKDTPYEGGVFTAIMTFPSTYPLDPPKLVFSPPLLHPNIYGEGPRAGEACISILHGGRDAFGYEKDSERWSPVQSVQTILLSIQSLMADANLESPANVEAASLMKRNPEEYKKRIREQVERSLGLRR